MSLRTVDSLFSSTSNTMCVRAKTKGFSDRRNQLRMQKQQPKVYSMVALQSHKAEAFAGTGYSALSKAASTRTVSIRKGNAVTECVIDLSNTISRFATGYGMFVFAFYGCVILSKELNKGKERPQTQTPWKQMAAALQERKVRSLTPFEAKSLVKNKGYVLLDVRKPEDFAKRHARGAINVPLFKNSEGTSGMDLLRTGLMKTQGLVATSENPTFVADVKALVPEGTGIITVDESVFGSLNRSKATAVPTQSRALMGAFLLDVTKAAEDTAGLGPIMHLEGGTEALFQEGFPQDPRPGV